MEVILSHIGADFDALSSMVAASKLYPQARLVLTGEPEPAVREFLTLHRGVFKIEKPRAVNPSLVSRAVVVDTRSPSRLGSFRQRIQEPGLEVHIYDHHPATPESIQGDVEVIEMLGAAVTVVLKRVLERGLLIEPLEATLFLIGLYEETGSLTVPSTTAEDMRMAAEMVERGGTLAMVPRFARPTLQGEQMRLLEALVASAERHQLAGYTIVTVAAETAEYVGELGLLTHRLLELEQSDAVLCAVRMQTRTYLVGRSRDAAVNVGQACRELGGGGHPTAASTSVPATNPRDLLRRALEILARVLPEPLTARRLMTPEVMCLDLTNPDMTVQEASEELRRLGHTAVVVRQHGELVGMLARSDLDKAMAHVLGHAPVRAFMTSPIVSVPPEANLAEIQQLLVERDIGRVPVVDGSTLVGIVSRTDLLRALYAPLPPKTIKAARTIHEQLLKLPEDWRDLLTACGQVGTREGVEVYAVGGFVRDLLLFAQPHQGLMDVDLVVEGSGIDYARALAEHLEASVRVHARFQTATLKLPDGRSLDVATARTETYCRPAALPVVTGSTLKQDLYRRDFSINALALRLTGSQRAQLVDYFGAQHDLESGVIRVLHNHSFIDDPIRILRGIRFEQRLHFHLEATTEHLLRAAVAQDILGQASPERVRDELLSCLQEPRPVPVLRRLDQLKILRAIHPALRIDKRVEKTLYALVEAHQALQDLLPDVEPWRLCLRAVVAPLKPEEIAELESRYRLRLPHSGTRMVSLIRLLSRAQMDNSELHRLLEPLSPDELVYLLSLAAGTRHVPERVRFFVERLRPLRPLVQGRHLQEWGYPPGPAYKAILADAFTAQLDGEFAHLEEAREWVRGRVEHGMLSE